MTIGSLVLRFRQTFQHGVRVAYWRDVVRQRILATKPICDTTDRSCEIHVFTSQSDWLNLLWAIKSFYWSTKRRFSLCIHEDGSLDAQRQSLIRLHFPQSRIVRRIDADERMAEMLRSYPRCTRFRETNPLAPKALDFIAHLEAEKMLIIDSDVLFFSEPTALLTGIDEATHQRNLFNPGMRSAYTVTSAAAESICQVKLVPLINSGLALIHRDSVRFEWMEEFLGIPEILNGHFWLVEQTLYALCGSRFGVDLLPKEYQVRLDAGLRGEPCRHYVGAIRHWMYGEGIRHLVSQGMLRDLS